MKIVGLQFNFYTKRMDTLKEDVALFEEASKTFFKSPLRLTGFDSSKPVDLPRIIGEPKMGFMYTCSMQNLQIMYNNIPAEIDDSFVLDTLSNIVEKMGSFLENYIDQPYNFVGFTLHIEVKENELGDNPLLHMIKKMPMYDTKTAIDNMTSKVAFIEPPYFVNFSMHNEHKMRISAPDKFSKPTSIEVGDDLLIVDFDVNDKYSFFNDPAYKPCVEDATRLVDNVIRFYNEEMLTFIREGKINHFFLGK